jgi:proteasome lid subunit RPN8/RPN11
MKTLPPTRAHELLRTLIGQRTPPSDARPRVRPLDPHDLHRPAPLTLTSATAADIQGTVGSRPAESGGMLGGVRGTGVVTRFAFDPTAALTTSTYYPDVTEVNRVLREAWNPAGVNLLGFVHSHPAGVRRPSSADVRYAERILAGIPELDRLLLPIVQTAPDTGRYELHAYAVSRRGPGLVLDDVRVQVLDVPPAPVTDVSEMQRVAAAYDLRAMATARLVAVGCGGGAAFLEDMARAGVGEFVLVDPDAVDVPNIATQQTYRDDVGRAKVEALARRLARISPQVRVWTVRAWLDELTDDAVRRLAVGHLPGSQLLSPDATLLCGFTDDFAAQARVSRLALHLGVAYLGATVYREGRGVEVTFSAPGLTPACSRCALRSRYVAQLAPAGVARVPSTGTPIWATARLNALKLPVALGLLHQVSRQAAPQHPGTVRHRQWLAAVADRNLAMVSLDPDIGTSLGLRAFARDGDTDDRTPVDRTLWLQQRPDRPEHGFPRCPDCGGTGDLSDSVGRFLDTRHMPLDFGDGRRH